MGSEHQRDVRAFYEGYGWESDEGGLYRDQTHAVDDRPFVGPYFERAQARLAAQLPTDGHLFLDAGCGPLPHPEQVDLSAGFDRRLCVDITQVALHQARDKLGTAGSYVQADLARLPFRSGAIDAFGASHVLYHLPAEDQEAAVFELQRVLTPGGRGVLSYATPRSPLTTLADPRNRLADVTWLRSAVRRMRSAVGRSRPEASAADGAPALPVHANPLRWWRRFPPGMVDVQVWAAADVRVTRRLPDSRVGASLLGALAAIEDGFPHLAARLGRYPLVVVRR